MDNSIIHRTVPQLRFPDFANDEEWEVKRLGDLFTRVTDKNSENNKNVLTISAQYGLVNQFEYFSKNVAATDVTNYYIIKKGDFAYNKSRSQGYPFGAIKPLLLYEKGVVSTLYICFRLKEESMCDADFFRFYFETGMINGQISNIAQEGARNHGLLNISSEDFFNILLRVPPLAEQQRIAACLSAADEMITSTNGKLEQLKAYKKGLMQQLFVTSTGGGKLLIINALKKPKLRFPEFYNEKEWEEKKLGEVCKLTNGMAFKPSDWQNSGMPIVRIQNLNDEKVEFNYCDPDDIDKKYMINSGSLLFSWSGTPGTSFGAYIWKRGEALLNQHIFIVDPIGIERLFLKMILDVNMSKIIEKSHGGAGLRHITKTDFEQIEIFVPKNLSEQCKIASCFSMMEDQINAYKEKVALLGQYKKGLMQRMFSN